MKRPEAKEINEHLGNGGVFQVTTYMKSVLYTQKHAGYFLEKNGSLYVQHGKRQLQLSFGENSLVSMRFGKIKGGV